MLREIKGADFAELAPTASVSSADTTRMMCKYHTRISRLIKAG